MDTEHARMVIEGMRWFLETCKEPPWGADRRTLLSCDRRRRRLTRGHGVRRKSAHRHEAINYPLILARATDKPFLWPGAR
jgi:hypothetical protein